VASKKEKLTKMPTSAKLEKMKLEDEGYKKAFEDAVGFLDTRRQAIAKIGRYYHLDIEELFQEGYEVLLKCLRDFTPVYQRADGSIVTVMFTTFFGSRMESCAMEMRNGNPEYKARQAFTEKLGDDEKERFRSDPPLLVQHLDHESPMQEMLAGEASAVRDEENGGIALKIIRDSFFENVLNDLVAKESDEKKKAALLHVKVGGVYNFQEIAYHFGVTDSRASQVMNELMDAFYVQRIIDGDHLSVSRDFGRLKFNEKRVNRLVIKAMKNSSREYADLVLETFKESYPSIEIDFEKISNELPSQSDVKKIEEPKIQSKSKSPVYQDVFTDDESKKYPLQGVELRSMDNLKSFENFDFHSPDSEDRFNTFSASHEFDDGQYPAVINEEGFILDGQRRVELAKEQGRNDYMCIVHRVPSEMDAKILRVAINMRTQKPSKIDLYYAISALSDIGLSQQKIADCVGTSRTNVLVYAKVKDKACAKLRALFEDGLIQVTNASTCADLSEPVQIKMTDFIRHAGIAWSKGSKFNDLHQAAVEGVIDTFIAKHRPNQEVEPVIDQVMQAAVVDASNSRVVQALKKRIDDYERDSKDSEIWTQRRESVIAGQKEDLDKANSEVDALKKELEAAELMRFGSPKVIEDELKELKAFYALNERLSGASHALEYALKDLRRLKLRRKQALEIAKLVELADQNLNALRVEVYNQAPKDENVKVRSTAKNS
jgi:predicted XRE-type DNA-binding protein